LFRLVELPHNICLHPLRHVVCPLEFVLYRLLMGANSHILLNFILNRIDYEIIGRRFLELQGKDFFEHFSQILRDYSEHFFRILYLQALSQEILELVASILELLMKITPWETIFIEQVDHDVHHTLYVISSRLVVAPARVKTGKEEVTRKLLDVLLFAMAAILFLVLTGQTEINKVDELWVFVPHEYVVKLQVIVHVAHLMKNSDTLDLNNR
jgi:hypothetical protein